MSSYCALHSLTLQTSGKGLTVYIFLWGVVVFVQAFFTNWAQFAAFRFLQGIFECTVR